MKRIFILILLFALLIPLQAKFGLLLMGCGNAGVSLDSAKGGDSGGDTSGGDTSGDDEETCDETGDDVTNGDATAEISGDPCSAPAASASTTDDNGILLGCSDRSTTDSSTDYTTVTCGTEDDAASNVYYCSSDNVVTLVGDSEDTELYESTNVACSDDNSDITDSEVTVSLIRP